jgi:hypothetical protein
MMLDLLKLNPKFKTWLVEQSTDRRASIMRHWEETATDPQVQHDGPELGRRYARATWVIQRCIEQHGFEP